MKIVTAAMVLALAALVFATWTRHGQLGADLRTDRAHVQATERGFAPTRVAPILSRPPSAIRLAGTARQPSWRLSLRDEVN